MTYPHIPLENWHGKHPDRPKDWWKIGKRVEWNGAKFTVQFKRKGYAHDDYTVILDEGEWPSDDDLLTICDGDIPPHARHFGGTVSKSGNKASVTVYTD